MTADQWNAATDPTPMLQFLEGKAPERKLRLFACACVSTVKGMPWEVGGVVRDVEKFCDGLLTWSEVISRLNRKAFQCQIITVGTNVSQFDFPPLTAPTQNVAEA